jgi:hypothetical protein
LQEIRFPLRGNDGVETGSSQQGSQVGRAAKLLTIAEPVEIKRAAGA